MKQVSSRRGASFESPMPSSLLLLPVHTEYEQHVSPELAMTTLAQTGLNYGPTDCIPSVLRELAECLYRNPTLLQDKLPDHWGECFRLSICLCACARVLGIPSHCVYVAVGSDRNSLVMSSMHAVLLYRERLQDDASWTTLDATHPSSDPRRSRCVGTVEDYYQWKSLVLLFNDIETLIVAWKGATGP